MNSVFVLIKRFVISTYILEIIIMNSLMFLDMKLIKAKHLFLLVLEKYLEKKGHRLNDIKLLLYG